MASTSYTQAMCDKLAAAIASGVRVVEYSEHNKVEYHSLDQMQRALASMQQAVNRAAGLSSFALLGTRKGF
jgi:hypothetical protein